MRLLASILAALVLFSCTEPIDINLNNDENLRLVVDAEIDNLLETDTIFLSVTSNFFDQSGPVPASGATVKITNDDGEFLFQEIIGSGRYISPANFKGAEGQNHVLNISYEGKSYTGSCFLNPPIKIDTLTSRRLGPDDFFNPDEVEIGISLQDPPGVRNYYWFIDFVNGKNEYEDLFEYGALFNDEIINGSYLDNIEYGTFDLKEGDTLRIELRTITKKVEEILIGLASESFRGGIFDSPPSNVPSNINNGALGIFVAYSRETKSIIIDK